MTPPPPIITGQRIGKYIPAETNAHAKIEEFFGRFFLFAVSVVLKESR
jgi:hypothetical protein